MDMVNLLEFLPAGENRSVVGKMIIDILMEGFCYTWNMDAGQ